MFVASRYATQILPGSNVVATRYATHKRSSSNVDKLHSNWMEFIYYIGGVFIKNGHFDCKISKNVIQQLDMNFSNIKAHSVCNSL